MPSRPPKLCATAGCGQVTTSRWCPACAKKHEAIQRQSRGKTAERGYGGRWQRASKAFLRGHPLCAECQRNGRVTTATVVDHIVPHRRDMRLFWDADNWQPLCKACHDRKTGAGA